VNRWRRQYLTARREPGIDHFAVFNFRLGNASPQSHQRRSAARFEGALIGHTLSAGLVGTYVR
jgi:hypothetical protein